MHSRSPRQVLVLLERQVELTTSRKVKSLQSMISGNLRNPSSSHQRRTKRWTEMRRRDTQCGVAVVIVLMAFIPTADHPKSSLIQRICPRMKQMLELGTCSSGKIRGVGNQSRSRKMTKSKKSSSMVWSNMKCGQMIRRFGQLRLYQMWHLNICLKQPKPAILTTMTKSILLWGKKEKSLGMVLRWMTACLGSRPGKFSMEK
mmetsp:Transcript_29722/g.51651  ORF Transcript_29722/g.51651 Transcript_29722/m.51651 type:complete len:202 (+) Transcript_29722:245-850(+)